MNKPVSIASQAIQVAPDKPGAVRGKREPFWSSFGLLPKLTRRLVILFVVPAVLLTLAAAATVAAITSTKLQNDAEESVRATAAAFVIAAASGAYTLDADYLKSIGDSIVKAPNITSVLISVPGLPPVEAHEPEVQRWFQLQKPFVLTLDIPSPEAASPNRVIGTLTVTAQYDRANELSFWLATSGALFVTVLSGALIALSLYFIRGAALKPLGDFVRFVGASSDAAGVPRPEETEIDALFRFSQGKVAALAANERRLSALISNVPGIVFRYRGTFERGRVEYISPTVETMLGYTPAEVEALVVENMLLPWMSAPSEYAADYVGYLKTSLGATESITTINEARTKDGRVRWMSLSARAVEEFADATFALEGVAVDVTDQHEKEREQELSDAREKELRAQLAETQKMELLGRLAGGIAHDFNNILGAVRSFADLIVEETSSNPKLNRYAQRIVTGCDRAADVVRQILLFARAKNAPREWVRVSAVVSEVDSLLRTRFSSQVELAISEVAPTLSVFANGGQLMQVLLNLAINAHDALEDRPGTVSITDDMVTIAAGQVSPFEQGLFLEGPAEAFFLATGTLRSDTTYVRFGVQDDGCGIPLAVASKIFEPFFTTKEKRKGSGLGLAVAHSIIAANAGVITVRSAKNRGSTFHVYLPANPGLDAVAEMAPLAHEQVEKFYLRGSERVLIVDDEVDVADGLSLMLMRLGYETAPIYSPLEALAVLREQPGAWDVLITDQLMPEMSGLELIRETRAVNPHIKSVLCTGFSERAPEDVLQSHGADVHFTKPIPATAIASAIRRLMDAQQADAPV